MNALIKAAILLMSLFYFLGSMDKIGKTVFATLKDAEAFVSARRKRNEQE